LRKHLKSEPDPAPLTRLQRLNADGLEPAMPPVRCSWIIDHLMELGPSEAGAMGPVPVTWREIDHWQQCLGGDLAPWTLRILRRLSLEFVGESQRARAADCPAPWTHPSNDHDRQTLSRKVSQTFRAILQSKEPT